MSSTSIACVAGVEQRGVLRVDSTRDAGKHERFKVRIAVGEAGGLLIPDSIFVPEGTYIFTAVLTYSGNTTTDTASFEIRR